MKHSVLRKSFPKVLKNWKAIILCLKAAYYFLTGMLYKAWTPESMIWIILKIVCWRFFLDIYRNPFLQQLPIIHCLTWIILCGYVCNTLMMTSILFWVVNICWHQNNFGGNYGTCFPAIPSSLWNILKIKAVFIFPLYRLVNHSTLQQ